MRLGRSPLAAALRAGLMAGSAVALLPACMTAAVGLTTAVASQEFIDHSTVAYVKEEHHVVWDQTKRTLERLSLDPVEVEEDARAARCNIEGARVIVHVEISGVNETKIAVGARKWGFNAQEDATRVLERIKTDLGR